MKILVLNGPNLNMLGIREKGVYGNQSYDELVQMIEQHCKEKEIEVVLKQSNHEGDLIDWIQEAYFNDVDGIIINPGGYTHTSIALADAIHAISPIPVVEVHISDISQREDYRKNSFCEAVCVKQIKGKGFEGYLEAIDIIKQIADNIAPL